MKTHKGDTKNLSSRRRRSITTPPFLIFLPIRQHVADPWAIGQLEDLLEIFLADFEWLGGNVGNVFADQLGWIDGSAVDFL